MVFKVHEKSDFLNDFWKTTKELVNISHETIDQDVINENGFMASFLDKKEMSCFVILNKAYYQYLNAFFILAELGMNVPAFNSLRSAIEASRLLRAYYTDSDFRKEYIKNENINFTQGKDYAFMQRNVLKSLDESEKKIRLQQEIPISPILHNHLYTKGSGLSELHSELSKWSHLLNVNLLSLPNASSRRVLLGLKDENTLESELFLKKYMEGAFILVIENNALFFNSMNSEAVRKIENEMIEKYEKYIVEFY